MKYLIPFISILLLFSCSPKVAPANQMNDKKPVVKTIDKNAILPDSTQIIWDNWGVPHIYAQNNNELMYSFGWAQMQSHANTIITNFGRSRGKGAEYWGESFVENDMLVANLAFERLARMWYNFQTSEFKDYTNNFVQGMNDYVAAHPEAVKDENKVALPILKEDILQHYLFVLYTRFIAGRDFNKLKNWESVGSNTYAIGPSKSASGKAMLVMNPHLPWHDEWLFYEGHFNAPGINTYGATLLGLPTLGIAFNENLGWSHTNNTIDNADFYEITLKDGGYVMDGEVKPLGRRKTSIKIKMADGSMTEKDVTLFGTIHGPIVKMTEDKALALRMPGFDRPYPAVQWWEMSIAQNFTEFETALKKVQIPFFNIMYADKEGNIFYMFNGQVPIRPKGDWNFWNTTIDGTKSELIWNDVHDYADLPKIKNPTSGWLQNANDPPWTSTFPNELDPADFPAYMAPIEMTFRPQRAARMVSEDDSITFEELQSYKVSTHLEMADRILDDLYEAIDAYGGPDALEAKTVLQNWDRNADSDSKGMALFYQWAWALNPYNQSIYAKQWNLKEARTTPDGLADPKAAVMALEGVVKKMKAGNIPLDIPWGQVYRIKYGSHDLPGNGADGSVGIFRVSWSEKGPQADGKTYIDGGDSWQSVIEFGDKVRAKVLMSYGNSTQEGSPHFGDQLELFAKKEMRDCLFYKEDVVKNIEKVETLKAGKFE